MLLQFLTLAFVLMMTTPIFAQTPPIETGVSQSLAKWRSANYSDVRYKLNITLEKGAPLMKGEIEIRVNLTDEGAKNLLILDWRTTQFANDKDKPYARVTEVNNKSLMSSNEQPYGIFNEHIQIGKELLRTGENVIKIEFASPIKTSGAAVTRYVDKEDGAEYVYSLFVPSDASTAFPVFDQPDLKARFTLGISIPKDWKVVTNSNSLSPSRTYTLNHTAWRDGFPIILSNKIFFFEETKPISTYVFAFAAGEFVEFEDKTNSRVSRESGEKKVARRETSGTNIKTNFSTEGATENISRISDAPSYDTNDTRRFTSGYFLNAPSARKSNDETENISSQKTENPSTKIYVRKSQSEKFKQHSAEVFRLNREGVKFLEDWFDYKFPFPKYDLVLIPEFPFGGMEHAGATFLREDRVIFPTEPTKNDYITRANVIFHEAAHQWFGDTVTMKWFDDLWLKEGFAEFMAYKTLEKVLPEYNAWKIFYERNKQAAYLTDVTRGTTPIYQEIPNLSSAKSAYGNIVYRKAPSFLKQAEFYLGEKEFQTAVRAFLKKHEFANAEWTDLVKEFETASKQDLKDWANVWVKTSGLPVIRVRQERFTTEQGNFARIYFNQSANNQSDQFWRESLRFQVTIHRDRLKDDVRILETTLSNQSVQPLFRELVYFTGLGNEKDVEFIFPNYQDYGYGIFLLDEKSRAYVLSNIQNEKDDFLRSMMWGSLWDSVRFYELAPEDYVELVIKNLNVETDESTIATLLNRVSTAMNYYISEGRNATVRERVNDGKENTLPDGRVSTKDELSSEIEKLLIGKIETAPTVGQKITYFRALQSVGSSEQAKQIFKDLLTGKSKLKDVELKTKDKFDIVTRLITLGDANGLKLLAELEKTETNDSAKRYAYAAKAGIPNAENKLKYWNDFVNNKEISESWIESAFNVWNSPKHAELTLPYLEKALAELPNLKKNRKIFFVNGWLSAFMGGQKSEEALRIVNKFLADNPDLDKDLRLKILENVDGLERAVKIRAKFAK